MISKTIEEKIADIEAKRNKAIEDKKKLDAKIKDYNDQIDLLRMQMNNTEMDIAVKILNEVGGNGVNVTLSDLVNLVKNNPQGITAMLNKSKSTSASDSSASLPKADDATGEEG